MDDLSEKLAGILNDPDSMERVRRMAESLLGGQQSEAPQPEQTPQTDSSFSLPSGDELKALMGIMSKLKSSGDDSRTQLLTALKPHLSEPRREKVDTAVKILKLLELMPYLKESGILNL